MSSPDDTSDATLRARKTSHLELCRSEQVEHDVKTTLFDDVELIHNSLPELSVDDIDTTTVFLGKTLQLPLLITGMTGGTAEAFAVNRDLATIAERLGIAFGLGSQRVMQRDPETAWTFAVREFAPTTVLLANIGLVQARDQSTGEVARLVTAVGADALCLHLNPAQELVQPEGDRDFRGGLETIARLSRELTVPIIIKETGCGVSAGVAAALQAIGVRYIDVSGAGGTSWVRVEMLRAGAETRRLGETFSNWGIPTAACLAMLSPLDAHLIASGGMRNGLDVAKALALGAQLCGFALPVYRAYRDGGIPAAVDFVEQMKLEITAAMVLTGSRTVEQLRRQPVVLGERIRAWLDAKPARSEDGRKET